MSSNLEEILELAKSRKAAKSSKPGTSPEKHSQDDGTDSMDNDHGMVKGADHGEWQDNEDMHAQGLTMGPSGNVQHGAMKIGHVLAVPKAKGKYIGIHHPTGAMTDTHKNRAQAAMALMAFHHYMPHSNEDKNTLHPGVAAFSATGIADVAVELAASEFTKKGIRSPKEGAKLYGSVAYGDPKNKRFPLDADHIHAALGYIDHEDVKNNYPLNGVTWASVKARVVAAAKKQGIKVAGD